MWNLFSNKSQMVPRDKALPGRADRPYALEARHTVNGHNVFDVPEGHEVAYFGLGCFWGAERLFWRVDGVYSTSVGYQGGFTPHPTYREVCSGRTGHNETVRVVWDPAQVSFSRLLKTFWEAHDPTQGMRQGNDVGTQYRSGIYTTTAAQAQSAKASREAYQVPLGGRDITTEVLDAPEFFYAEDHHQQYLDKNPGGYCGLRGTGVSCPIDG